jgi:hypothetical protein
MSLNRNDILKSGARLNFWLFCCYYDYEFFYKKRPFLYDVALLFQEVIEQYKQGNAISVSVSMPPRAGKSYITSLFAAYWLAKFPELSVMRNSCTATLYQKFSYDTRNIIRSSKFREVFPEVQLQGDKQNLDGWNISTSKQVGYFGSGVGGTIIGFGANLAITDDLYKSMEDALSTNTNDKVKMWKQSAHDSRKEKNCPEIYIGTRWTKEDIIGDAIESGKLYKSIKIPALINDESFCEDVKSTKEYLAIRNDISKMVWLAEYMQDPTNPEGLLIPFEKLKFIDISKIPQQNIIYRFSVIDPADNGGDKFSNPFIFVAQIDNSIGCFVSDITHNGYGIEANVGRVIEKVHTNNIEQLAIEKNGIGLAAVLLLSKQMPSFCQLVPFNSTINKEVRILSNYDFIMKYFYFDSEKYKTDAEYKSFVYDLTNYSRESDNKHKKDAIDVLSSAAHIMKLKYNDILYKQ